MEGQSRHAVERGRPGNPWVVLLAEMLPHGARSCPRHAAGLGADDSR